MNIEQASGFTAEENARRIAIAKAAMEALREIYRAKIKAKYFGGSNA